MKDKYNFLIFFYQYTFLGVNLILKFIEVFGYNAITCIKFIFI